MSTYIFLMCMLLNRCCLQNNITSDVYMIRIFWIDPKSMVVNMNTFCGIPFPPSFSSIIGYRKLHSAQVNSLWIVWIDPDHTEIHRAGITFTYFFPSVSPICRSIYSSSLSFYALYSGIQKAPVSLVDIKPDSSFVSFWSTLVELLPTLSTVIGAINTRA